MDKEGGGHSHECCCILCRPGKPKPWSPTHGSDSLPGADLAEPLQSAPPVWFPNSHCAYGAASDLCTLRLFGDPSSLISLLKQK